MTRNTLYEGNPRDFTRVKLQEGKGKNWAKKVLSLSPHKDIMSVFRRHKTGKALKHAKNRLSLGLTSASAKRKPILRAGMRRLSTAEASNRTKMFGSSNSAAKKLAIIGVGVTAAGLARKAYKARKVQVNLKPAYRKYDVYPEHNHAVVPAHRTNRPYYDDSSGGRSVAHYAESVMTMLNKNRLLEDRLKQLNVF